VLAIAHEILKVPPTGYVELLNLTKVPAEHSVTVTVALAGPLGAYGNKEADVAEIVAIVDPAGAV
jgi:hypothetical protein